MSKCVFGVSVDITRYLEATGINSIIDSMVDKTKSTEQQQQQHRQCYQWQLLQRSILNRPLVIKFENREVIRFHDEHLKVFLIIEETGPNPGYHYILGMEAIDPQPWTLKDLMAHHKSVQEWIETVRTDHPHLAPAIENPKTCALWMP